MRLVSDDWIARRCAEVRRLLDDGERERAANLAARIERIALRDLRYRPRPQERREAACARCGAIFRASPQRRLYCSHECYLATLRRTPEERRETDRRYHQRLRAIGCSAKGCQNKRIHAYRPWCWRHAPHVYRMLRRSDRERAISEALWRLDSRWRTT